MSVQNDLFGNQIETNGDLFDRFIIPPFSVFDTRQDYWIKGANKWKNIGIISEVGREGNLTYSGNVSSFDYYRVKEGKIKESGVQGTSIFDPFLCEIIYNWFCKSQGKIIDPFAGGSVRGIVANKLGYNYTGIDLRVEQINSNIEQGKTICKDNCPIWICGDSELVLNKIENNTFDFAFTCPPYGNLEKYSDLEEDLSNMDYYDFILKYSTILEKTVEKLKDNSFFIIVVGEFRDKKGNYVGFIKDTINIMLNIKGIGYYNEIILLNQVASASMRAGKVFESGRKVTKIHQNILVFIKGDPKKATEKIKNANKNK